MTLTSFLITNFVDQSLGLPSNAYDSFSGLMQAQIVIDTSFGIGTDYGQLFIRMGMFTQIGDNSATSTNNTPPTLYFKYDSSTVVATQYDLQFLGTDFGKIRGKIQVNDNVGLVQFQIDLFFQATQDEIGYITNSISNIRQLSFNNRTNTNKFQNAGNSVYVNVKELSLACYFVLDSDNSTTFRKFSKQLQLGFYNPTAGGIHTGTFTVLRNAIPFTYLNGGVNNIEFAFTEVYTPAFIVVQIFNENAPNTPNLTYSANIQQTCRGGSALPVLVFNQITDYEYLDQVANPLSNGTYAAGLITFDINGALLATNGAYRIIVNVYADNGWGAFDGFSFISNQYQVLNPPEHDGRPLLTFRFLSKTNFLGGNAVISSHDKLGMFFVLSSVSGASPYESVTGRSFSWNLSTLKIQMYYIDSIYKHIVFNKVWSNLNTPNNKPNIFGANDGLSIPFDILDLDSLYYLDNGGDFISFFYQFRIRYESGVLNIQTINTITNTVLNIPSGNQDWQGKTIFVEITADTVYNESYVFVAPFEVRTDSNVSLELQSVNNCTEPFPNVFLCDPLLQFCKEEEIIQLVATSTFNYSEPVLWSIDKKQYSSSQAKYSELDYSGLSFLIKDFTPILQPRTGTNTLSIIRVDTNDLVTGAQYRFSCVMRDLSGVANNTYSISNGVFTYTLNGLQFVYTQDPTQHESGSYTGVLELPLMIECGNNSNGYITDPCELWNRKHCNSDIDFYLPICVIDPSPVLPTFDLCIPCSILPAEFDTMNLVDIIAEIETEIIFIDITGLIKVELYLRSEFGNWILVETFLSPTLTINYLIDVGALELLGGLYYFKVVYYSTDCFAESAQFPLEVHGV